MVQPVFNTFIAGIIDTVVEFYSKALSNEKIKPSILAKNNGSLKLRWMNNSKVRAEFKKSCLNWDKVTFTSIIVVNLYFFYELDTWLRNLNFGFTVKDYFFGAVTLNENADQDKLSYSGWGSWFVSHSFLSLLKFDLGKKAIIFGVENSSSMHIDNTEIYLSSWWRPNRMIRWYYDNRRSKIFH